MVFNRKELIRLARTYCAAVNIPLSRLGAVAAGNPKLFNRLIAGEDCYMESAERASAWFWDPEHWPLHVPWPKGVPAPPGVYVVAKKRRNGGTGTKAGARRGKVSAAAA